MDTGNINNSSPSTLLHLGKCVFGSIERWAQIERDNFFPNVLGEIFHSADVLHSSIIDEDVNFTKVGNWPLN